MDDCLDGRKEKPVHCVPYENYLLSGYPRNDPLAKANEETKREMRRKIGIPVDKIVLLYAPTFREYERDASLNCVLKPPVSFKKWREQLGNEYQILMRCHYEVTKLFSDEIDGEFVIDVSDYPTLNELMIASDALITDYSSIMFDYSILDRPIYIFAYDYDEYEAKRGIQTVLLLTCSLCFRTQWGLLQSEQPHAQLLTHTACRLSTSREYSHSNKI